MTARLATALRRPLWFCLAAGAAMVALRLVCWDWRFFALQGLPNHDLYQGASFFATSSHSLRESGEIAFWNPIGFGYAQYYQAFFAPIAPTASHPLFFVWGQIVALAGVLGISIPEFTQYLAFTYVLLPLVALSACAAFLWLVFDGHRGIVLTLLVVYTLSGIGIWNSAWFTFQEPGTLFLLLAAGIAVLKRPTGRRFALLGAAVLLQVASVNYWTVYNLFFLVAVVLAYGSAHREEVRDAWAVARGAMRSRAPRLLVPVAAMFAAVMASLALSAAVVSAGGEYERTEERYTQFTAREEVHEARSFTTELFNPSFERANAEDYAKDETVHNARYMGAFLLPFLLIVPLLRWRSRERWLVRLALAMLAVVLAPAVLIAVWDGVPFMDNIRHVFYFYTQYWQLALLLLAGAGLLRLTRLDLDADERRRAGWVAWGAAGLGVLGLVVAGLFASSFRLDDPRLQSALLFAIVVIVASVAAGRLLLDPTRKAAALLVVLVLGIAVVDLSRYFFDVQDTDADYTAQRWGTERPPPDDVQDALGSEWDVPPGSIAPDLFPNMPVQNQFWPGNGFIAAKADLESRGAGEDYSQRIAEGPELQFAPVLERSGDKLLTTAEADPIAPGEVDWTYNDVSFSARAPEDGWLVVRQLADDDWEAEVDGREAEIVQANFVAMAIPVEAGEHRVELSFSPPARALHRPVGWVVVLVIAFLLATALRAGRSLPSLAPRGAESGPPPDSEGRAA